MINLENIKLQPCIKWENLPFDKSLEVLMAAGYERHMRPEEYAQAFMENYFFSRSDLKQAYGKNFRSIVNNVPDFWLSFAMRREGSKLHVAIDPKNLSFSEKGYCYPCYVTPNNEALECHDMQTFEIGKFELRFYDVHRRASELPKELIGLLGMASYEKNDDCSKYLIVPPADDEPSEFWWAYKGCSHYMSFMPAINSHSVGAAQKRQDVEKREIKIINDGQNPPQEMCTPIKMKEN